MHRAADARSIDGAIAGVRSRVEDGAALCAGHGAPRPRATSSATGHSSPASVGASRQEQVAFPGFVVGVHAAAGASSLAMRSKLYAAPTAAGPNSGLETPTEHRLWNVFKRVRILRTVRS